MDRMACVDVPAFPLQLLLKQQPGWRGYPAAVVDRDKPQGIVLWCNEAARTHGIHAGMRFAAALSLGKGLRAGEVSEGKIKSGVDFLVGRLRNFCPHVEPDAGDPGLFWLDPSGLGALYRSPGEWAARIRSDLGRHRFRSAIVVGFTRFGTYAAAKGGVGRGVVVFRSRSEERAVARRVPLRALTIDPAITGELGKLGVSTVGDFLDLPPGGIRERFGPGTHRLYERASDIALPPFQPVPETVPLVRRSVLEVPEADVSRLLFVIKRLLDSLLAELVERHEALTSLTFDVQVEGAGKRVERIRPATATLDVRQLMNLVRLRLESIELTAGVESIEVAVQSVRLSPEQQTLFASRPRRDLEAGDRALARIRAEFGEGTVSRARLTEGHLPEARFSWEPLEHLASPSPRTAGIPCLVRRIQETPQPLPPRPRNDPDGWLLRGEENGNVVDFIGPYIVSGGWWRRALHREYHFAEMRSGEVYWVYYDRNRRHWFLQGRVE